MLRKSATTYIPAPTGSASLSPSATPRDHFINYHLIGHEIDLLTKVKSLTFRLFTDKEGAENHCNVGNGKLALDTIDCWLTGLRRRDED